MEPQTEIIPNVGLSDVKSYFEKTVIGSTPAGYAEKISRIEIPEWLTLLENGVITEENTVTIDKDVYRNLVLESLKGDFKWAEFHLSRITTKLRRNISENAQKIEPKLCVTPTLSKRLITAYEEYNESENNPAYYKIIGMFRKTLRDLCMKCGEEERMDEYVKVTEMLRTVRKEKQVHTTPTQTPE